MLQNYELLHKNKMCLNVCAFERIKTNMNSQLSSGGQSYQGRSCSGNSPARVPALGSLLSRRGPTDLNGCLFVLLYMVVFNVF